MWNRNVSLKRKSWTVVSIHIGQGWPSKFLLGQLIWNYQNYNAGKELNFFVMHNFNPESIWFLYQSKYVPLFDCNYVQKKVHCNNMQPAVDHVKIDSMAG